jgi:uncharacterized protein
MIVEDQSDTIAFLQDRRTHNGVDVERIDTHGAVVFLAGERAYKLKRAVKFPYMDLSTVDKRRKACEAELRVNRRTAPMLYRRAMPVTRGPQGLELAGAGRIVDWVVVMQRFDQATLFDRMAEAGTLRSARMTALAEQIAKFQDEAERRPEQGGEAGLAWHIEANSKGTQEATPGVFAANVASTVEAGCRDAAARLRDLLEARRAAGFVRHGHGDLHLRNICLVDDTPTLFDAIEFDDRIACVDTLFDVAFLLMDLERRGLRALANAAFNRYLEVTGDYGGLAALPLFMACRAWTRAHTLAAAAAAQKDAAQQSAMRRDARAALDLAAQLLNPVAARVVAIGGLSGTGKSTVARQVAPEIGRAPGAVVVRSDVLRKRLSGVVETTKLGPEGYTLEMSTKVYAALIATAGQVAQAGQGVIADAVFARAEERAAIRAAAQAEGVAFTGIWLTGDRAVLEARVAARRGDASDADVDVVRQQAQYDLGGLDWAQVDAGGSLDSTLAAVRTRLI